MDDVGQTAPGAEDGTERLASGAPQNNADVPGASAVPAGKAKKVPRTKAGKPDKRHRAAYSEGEQQGKPAGRAVNGGGIGAHLTPEEKEEMRRNVRNARKRDQRARQKKERERLRKGSRKGKQGTPYVKDDEQPGAPAWEPTEEIKEQIATLAGFGLSIDETSVVLGISAQTLHAHMTEVDAHRARGLAIAKSRVRQSGYQQAVSGSLGHWRFFEEVVLGYRPTQRMEQTGANGGPIATQATFLSDDDLLARLRTMADKQASVIAASQSPGEPAEA